MAEELYAHSRAMQRVREQIARAGAVRTGLVIRGEHGTGRTVVARNVHAAGAGAASLFVTVDCAAAAPEQMERQLFGDASRPSPNDGDGERRGLERVTRDAQLVAANGGTLYLRNLADMPARLQTRIARVLRDREAILAANGQTIGIDVRPIAAVECDLHDAVADGRLRDDLVRRLAAGDDIHVPALRDRREDLPALASHFVRGIAAARRLAPRELSRPALSLLSALPWRANAPELRQLLEHVLAAGADEAPIAIEEVLAHVQLDGGAVVATNRGTLRQARAQFERDYIVATLDQHRGRIGEAAKALGIQRTNLYRKMRSLRVVSKRPHNGAIF